MKIAVYSQLPNGGARVATNSILSKLGESHQISNFTLPPSKEDSHLFQRLRQDFNSLVKARKQSKLVAQKIDSQSFDACIVTHDSHIQAPWVLRYLKTPTIFLCQEPTRAFFEQFLEIDDSWPLINQIYERSVRLVKKKIEINNAQKANQIISNSAFGAESILRAYGVSAIPAHLGVNLDRFYPSNKKRTNQVFIVGNAEPQKGLSFAIETLGKVTKKLRPKLIIAGPRPSDYSYLEKLASKNDVNIQTFSSLSQDQMRLQYQVSKLTLATAYLEPFGLSAIESMACATPVVAVNEGGFKETIIHNQTGLLLPRDTKVFANKLQFLLKDQDKLDKLASQSVKQAQKFTWEKTSEIVNKALQHAAS